MTCTACVTPYEAAWRAVNYIREHDCDFLTIDNVIDYARGAVVTERDAEAALRIVMGHEWFETRGIAWQS